MENPKFKVGDVVKFNSGGIPMTVISIAEKVEAIYIYEGKPQKISGIDPLCLTQVKSE